jgi:hypothetical protein
MILLLAGLVLAVALLWRQSATLIDMYQMPGMNSPAVSTECEFIAGTIASWQLKGVVIDSGAVDAGSTPTTTLRRGLVMARLTSSGNFTNYDPTQTGGQNIAVGLLFDNTNMLDINSGVVANKIGRIVPFAFDVKASQCFGLDTQARRQMRGIYFDDTWWANADQNLELVEPHATSYTILATDNNKTFTTRGAVGAVTFTLPTLARGLKFSFVNEAAQNMAVTGAAANLLVTFNNLTATTVTFSTAGQLIGANVDVVANEDATKWLVIQAGAHTMTVS